MNAYTETIDLLTQERDRLENLLEFLRADNSSLFENYELDDLTAVLFTAQNGIATILKKKGQ